MRGRTSAVRAIALLAAASAAVHQLRYAIGYGDGASHALAAHPHGYLTLVLPGALTAMLIALGAALMRGARGRVERVQRARIGFSALWLASAGTLAAIYAAQETLEGSGAVAHGGWIGLALAVPAGALVALALRGAAAAEAPREPATPLLASFVALVPVRIGRASAPALITIRSQDARGPPAAFVV